jgi:hypothetical protein
MTASAVANTLSTNNARLTDLHLRPDGLFDVVEVSNVGTYATAWWWYLGLTASQVTSDATTNNARAIVIQGYFTASGLRFDVVMVDNTGANYEAWSWRYGSERYLRANVTTASRPVSFGYAGMSGTTPFYTVAYVDNTGANALNWMWSFSLNQTDTSTLIKNSQMRLVDEDQAPSGSTTMRCVLLYANPDKLDWGWQPFTSLSGAIAFANRYAARVIDLSPIVSNGVVIEYDVILINDTSAMTTTLFDILNPTIPVPDPATQTYPYHEPTNGNFGFYIGNTSGYLAGMQHNAGFEPASALKVLIHVYLIHEESLGVYADSTAITYYDSVTYGYEPCPDTNPDPIAVNSTIAGADTAMMRWSDNGATAVLEDMLGKTNILAYAKTLGMTSVQLNHHIGCATPANVVTLTDLATLYNAIANNKITKSIVWNGTIRARMLNETNIDIYSTLCPIVSAEAQKLGKSSTTANKFCHMINWIGKGGDYVTTDVNGVVLEDTSSTFCLTGLPYKTASGTVHRVYFTQGAYVDGITLTPQQPVQPVTAARAELYNVSITPYIDAGLETWSS